MKRFLVVAAFGLTAVAAMFLLDEPGPQPRYHCRNLKTIAFALHQYHDAYHGFPPAFVRGPDGSRWHSWRTLVLEFLDPELHRQYRFDEPWNGPNNSRLTGAIRKLNEANVDGPVPYVAILGRRTMWPAWQNTRLRDMFDGPSNTIMLACVPNQTVPWLKPTDTTPGAFLRAFSQQSDDQEFCLAMADGAVISADSKSSVTSEMIQSWLTPAMSFSLFRGDEPWPEDLQEDIRQPLRAPQPSHELPHTEVVATPFAPLDAEVNQIWCVTFPLCWNELKTAAGGNDIQPVGDAETFDRLNRCDFDRRLLSENAYIISAQPGTPANDQRLRTTIQQRFPGTDPTLAKVPANAPSSLRLFSILRKQMPFETVFDSFKKPLVFQTSSGIAVVRSFGNEPSENDQPVFRDQLEILDDRGDNDVVVCLKTSVDQRDQIILAMHPGLAEETDLASAWKAVQQRIENPNPEHDRDRLDANETLQIPILDIAIRQEFPALRQRIQNTIDGIDNPARIEAASQVIQFRLDETGADFLGQGEILVVGEFGEPDYDPHRIRRFLFNQPFLLAIREPGTDHPWLLAWIAQEEVMVATRKPNGQ